MVGPIDIPRVCVVGSVNLDIVAVAPRLPAPGETVSDASLGRHPGGKGANQALAAKRQGAEVTLIAAVGRDSPADEALVLLRREGVDLSRLVTIPDVPTGVALIVVDANGENQITVAPGANRYLRPAQVKAAGFDAVLCQLEIRDDTVVEAARQATGLLCVNAAPARSLAPEVLERADVIIVNETERAALAGQLDRSAGVVVVTRGADGADALRNGTLIASAASPTVDAVDTVGAGDAFCGTLVVAMASGLTVAEALPRACRAGALAATRSGAQPSLPTAAEIA